MTRTTFFSMAFPLILLLTSCDPAGQGTSRTDIEEPAHGWGEPGEGWMVIEGAEVIQGPHSDGDSIQVRHEGSETVYRLYWVDSVEKNPTSVERRIAQTLYFGVGGDPNQDGLRLAKEASDFTQSQLANGAFRIFTKGERVSEDNPSIRAYVETAQGDLGVQLVRAGLALVRGGVAESEGPDGSSADQVRTRLHALEDAARGQGAGAWGMAKKARESAVDLPEGVYSADQKNELLRASGKQVRVRGTVSRIGTSRALVFVNFAGGSRGDFVVISHGNNFRPAGGLEPETWWRRLIGKEIEVEGEVTIYQGTPQIEVEDSGQVSEVGASSKNSKPQSD